MNYLDTLKNIVNNKEKRAHNLILLVILLVVVLVACKYIFPDNNIISNNTSTKVNIDNKDQDIVVQTNLEAKLESILSQIGGISDVSVVLTYMQDSVQKPIYNTKEQEVGDKKTVEKSVAYNESSGVKTALIETIEVPKVEGAIIVAKGANTVDIRSKIATAISIVTALPVYKVQVFEKQG